MAANAKFSIGDKIASSVIIVVSSVLLLGAGLLTLAIGGPNATPDPRGGLLFLGLAASQWGIYALANYYSERRLLWLSWSVIPILFLLLPVLTSRSVMELYKDNIDNLKLLMYSFLVLVSGFLILKKLRKP